MTAMNELDKRAKALAESRAALAEIVSTLNEGIEALKKQHMKRLKQCVAKVAEHHDQLKAVIEANPSLFVKPRTMTLSGIKLGMGKGKGAMDWDDDERVCKAIRKLLPEQASVLINTKDTPSKDALQHLKADQLKKLGITVKDAGDQVVIKHADQDVEKLVKALVKGATEDADA